MSVNGPVEAGQVEKLTELGADVSKLTQLLHIERMAAAAFLADPKAGPDAYNATVRASDAEIQRYRDPVANCPARRPRSRAGWSGSTTTSTRSTPPAPR